ncbi:hypothetical protein SEVIR_6G130360v4 [Setaria viridis]
MRTERPVTGSQTTKWLGICRRSWAEKLAQKRRMPSRVSARAQRSTSGRESREKLMQRLTTPESPGGSGLLVKKVGLKISPIRTPLTFSTMNPSLQMKKPRSGGGWRRRNRRSKAGEEATRRQCRQTAAARAR